MDLGRWRSVYWEMRYDELPLRTDSSQLVHVVIETPRGSRNKYSYEPALGEFKLKKLLPQGHVFPFDFGFFPNTRGGDGDPVDVLVLMDEPASPGVVVECRIIGVMQAKQVKAGRVVRNDRFIAVADTSLNFKYAKTLRDLDAAMLEQIRKFFISYIENAGGQIEITRTLGATAALRRLRSAKLSPA